MVSFIILSLIALALAVISCTGNAESAYTSLPMILAWGAVVCTATYQIVKRKLYRRPAVFLLHCAFAVILVGALLTHLFGTTETLRLRVGDKTSIGPMTVELKAFDIKYYPGTQAPSDFVSSLLVDGKEATVAINKVYTAGGYRLFQTAYDSDGMGTILTVSHDAIGTAVSYTGYALLMLAMLWCMGVKLSHRSQCAMLLMAMAVSASAMPRTVPKETADEFGKLLVYTNGRVAPLSTLARNFTVKLTGSSDYRGLTPEQVMTGWIFYYDSWRNEPCIKISDSATRKLLGIEGKYAALPDYFSPTGDYLVSEAGHADANEKFGLASSAATGSLWTIFPLATDGGMRWLSPADQVPDSLPTDTWHFISHSFNYLSELASKSDWETLNETVRKIGIYQYNATENIVLPSQRQLHAEKLFVSLSPMLWPAIVLILGGLALFIFFCSPLARCLCAAGMLWTLFLIALNWTAQGRVPMSNGYETMQCMAFAACTGGLCMPRRFSAAIPLCTLVGGMAMLVAMMGTRTPQVTQVVPVLRSPLLSIHVLTVMLAYTGLAIMALCGIAWLCGKRDLLPLSRLMLEPSVFLLTAGIFIGAIWANQSWGRYWGWDPKEVWALITMLVYSLPLHKSTLPCFKSDRCYAIFTVAAFLTVLMTYFGVNFILGGLHGYA